MPRDIPLDAETSFDSQRSAQAVVCFLTVQHPRLSEPATVASSPYGDNVGNHRFNGVLYGGIPFKLVDVSDDDREPRGRLEMLNYQFKPGQMIEALKTRPRVTIEHYLARDFDPALTGTPPAHEPLAGVAPRRTYRAAWLTLVNVKVGTWVTGDLASYALDMSRERASPMRATQDIAPGLYVSI
ncbi:MAG: hypothetical protein Q8M03_06990 [Legionella sp.]|nr:hypothetical protein [Legionella sp.]